MPQGGLGFAGDGVVAQEHLLRPLTGPDRVHGL